MIPSLEHYATHDESEFPHLWEGIAGAWAPCLGVTGERLYDHSRMGNRGTLTNMNPATDWQIDAGQYALRFGGVSQYVAVPFRNLAASSFSLSVWHKNTRTGPGDWDTIVSLGALSGGFMLDGYANQTTRRYAIRGSGITDYLVGNTTYALNAWNHIGYVQVNIAGTNFGILYLNGKADSVLTSVGSFTPATDPTFLSIGSYYQGQFAISVEGFVDDLIFYDRPVAETNITELYQIGRGGIYTPKKRRPIVIDLSSSRRRRLLLMGQP